MAVAAIAAAGVLALSGWLYVRRTAPPGEEWISYGNEEIIASIDRQTEGLDMKRLMEEKEPFVVEQSIEELQNHVSRGELTYEELTAVCLYRIKTLDQKHHGYNSVMEIAPDALEQARARDRQRAEMTKVPPLFGIPVMFKDNINTAGIPTSAGAVAFAGYVPEEDAEIVRLLKEQGMIVLGKNNLTEFAGYVSGVMPGGYSGKKGQTVNPFGPLKISPSGSSSGSAVAVSANLTPVSIGTETAGSIAGPAAANSVTGFKPSRSSMPGEGIFPLISEVDTAGPITRCVEDAALVYEALTQTPAGTAVSPLFDKKALHGAVIGLISYEYNDENMVYQLRKTLEEAGCQVMDVDIEDGSVQVQNIIGLSFWEDFEEFARKYGLPVTGLPELIEYNRADEKRRIRYGQDKLEEALADGEAHADGHRAIRESISAAKKSLDMLLTERGLDAIVYLNSTVSTTVSAAGYPQLTVPFGEDGRGVPQGATFAAGDGEDGKLLKLGYAFEQAAGGRMIP